MTQALDPGVRLEFEQDRLRALPQMANYLCAIALVGFSTFAVADRYVTIGSTRDIYAIRAVVLASLTAYWLLMRFRGFANYYAGAVLLCLCGFGILGVSFATHDPTTRYIYALGVAFVGWGTMVPTTLWM